MNLAERLAFKIMDDKIFGALTFVRIYSGVLNKGDTILNSATGKTERIGRMVEMHADDRNELSSAQAGDIIAIVGMKNVQTGHTLCSQNDPCTLEPMIFPDPVISIAVSPKDKGGSEKMGIALGKMIAEDPRSVLRPMKTAVRLSLKVWVNYTWILKWIS